MTASARLTLCVLLASGCKADPPTLTEACIPTLVNDFVFSGVEPTDSHMYHVIRVDVSVLLPLEIAKRGLAPSRTHHGEGDQFVLRWSDLSKTRIVINLAHPATPPLTPCNDNINAKFDVARQERRDTDELSICTNDSPAVTRVVRRFRGYGVNVTCSATYNGTANPALFARLTRICDSVRVHACHEWTPLDGPDRLKKHTTCG